MKSKRSLKKEIKRTFNSLYTEIFFYEAFALNADANAVKAILEKIISTENELIGRISVNEGRYVKGRVKSYFKKLEEDFRNKVREITKDIAALP